MAGSYFHFQRTDKTFEPILKVSARGIQPYGIARLVEASARSSDDSRSSVALPRRQASGSACPAELARRHLRDRYPELIPNGRSLAPAWAYFHGCAANYFDDGVGDAVIAVLRKHGVEPDLPPQRCSERRSKPMGTSVWLKEGARVNLASMAAYDKVVTGCASCTLMLKDYPTCFRNETGAGGGRGIGQESGTYFRSSSPAIAETSHGQGSRTMNRVAYHSSCHLRAAGVTKEPRRSCPACRAWSMSRCRMPTAVPAGPEPIS